MLPNKNALLSTYAADPFVAGQAKVLGRGKGFSVADALRDNTNQYGPSQKQYTEWKKSGIPTSQILTSNTFGLATKKGDSAGDAMRGVASILPPPPQAVSRANPITWTGDEMAPTTFRPRAGKPSEPLLPPEPPQPFAPRDSSSAQQMSSEELQQTWSQLMANKKFRPSAAMSIIDLPKEYYAERPPPMPAVNDQSMPTIGLHPQNGGRPVRRTASFTNTFTDPFGDMY